VTGSVIACPRRSDTTEDLRLRSPGEPARNFGSDPSWTKSLAPGVMALNFGSPSWEQPYGSFAWPQLKSRVESTSLATPNSDNRMHRQSVALSFERPIIVQSLKWKLTRVRAGRVKRVHRAGLRTHYNPTVLNMQIEGNISRSEPHLTEEIKLTPRLKSMIGVAIR